MPLSSRKYQHTLPVHLQLEHLEESVTKTISVLCRRVTLLESIVLKEFGSRRIVDHYSVLKLLKANFVQLQLQCKMNAEASDPFNEVKGNDEDDKDNMDFEPLGYEELAQDNEPNHESIVSYYSESDEESINADTEDPTAILGTVSRFGRTVRKKLPFEENSPKIRHSSQSPFSTILGPSSQNSRAVISSPVRKKIKEESESAISDDDVEWEAVSEVDKIEDDHEYKPRPHMKPICEQCGASFVSASNLRVHQQTVHEAEEKFICELCNEKFRTEFKRNRHVTTHHSEDRPYHCEICKAGFLNLANLQAHQRVHDGVRPYTCEQCSKSYKHKTGLRRHILFHKQIRPFSCPKCPQKFYENHKVRRHLKVVHKITDPIEIPREVIPKAPKPPRPKPKQKYGRIICDVCGKNILKRGYRDHLRTRHGNDVACPVCDKRFPTEYTMNKHKAFAHDPTRPHPCPYEGCGLRFKTPPNLRQHMVTHESHESAYHHQCKPCGLKYKHSSSLEKHINAIHTHEKLYPCDMCLRILHSSSHLKRHLIKVHKLLQDELKNHGVGSRDKELPKVNSLKGEAEDGNSNEHTSVAVEVLLDLSDIQQVVEIDPSTQQ